MEDFKMFDWKKWCCLCGGWENVENVEDDIGNTLENIFEIQSRNTYICIDCNAYVHDFQEFFKKSKIISSILEDLNQKHSEGSLTNETIFEIRQILNLPINQLVMYLHPETIEEDLIDIVQFELIDNNQDEIEYLIDDGNKFDDQNTEEEKKEENEILSVEKHVSETVSFETFDCFTEEEEISNENDLNDSSKLNFESFFDLSCHICGESFEKIHFLCSHMKSVHNTKPKVNCVSGKIIESTQGLNQHYEEHVMDKKEFFRCSECNKTYQWYSGFKNHMKTYHGELHDQRKFHCDVCGKSFKEARHLSVHMNSHLPDELKFVHTCEYCDKKYSSTFSLKQHIKHVHVKDENFKCHSCDKTFSRKANLDSHLNHVHTTERKFSCDVCGLKLKTKSILRVHKKIHSTNPDDFLPCPTCKRQFKTQNQLTNHMISHNPMKRFKCTICPAEYKRSKELNSHISSLHTGVHQYSCEWCPKKFFNNSNFRKHKLKLHQKEIEDIEIKIENLIDVE
ncbi:CLUMA_CG018230, isoform A [Clunio marinus]|uniref:CLUMA_CG018230, isoform A n=1 Tax=Clunio marinus TaxID=568069 RepID=A0A1J1IYU1_9DIPT|nr:CLUMA_CG018230, isoform A [Clunio marinus]